MSIGIHGEKPRELATFKYPTDVAVSPDGRQVAFTEGFRAFSMPLPMTGKAIEIGKDGTAVPVAKLAGNGAGSLHWSADSKTVHWLEGSRYLSQAPGGTVSRVDVGLDLPADAPTDVVAFTGGRVVTMRDAQARQEVIEDGVVLVRGTDIVAVGKRGDVAVPAGARVIDASGKTLFPGIVDVHAHAAHFGSGVVAQQNWAYYVNLAFGITTMHDPSASTEMVFAQAELQKAGVLVARASSPPAASCTGPMATSARRSIHSTMPASTCSDSRTSVPPASRATTSRAATSTSRSTRPRASWAWKSSRKAVRPSTTTSR